MTPATAKAVETLRRWGPMRAGELGYRMWAKPGHCCKDENAQATMFCRAASAILRRAQREGLVRWREHGKSRFWEATDAPEKK